MPREKEWAGWGIEKTPATGSAFSQTTAIHSVVYTGGVFHFHQSHQKVNLLKLVSKEQEGRSLSQGHEIFHALINRLCYKGCPRHNVASVGWRSEWLEPRSELSDFSNT